MKPYALFFATNRRFLFALAVMLMSLRDKFPKVLEKADVLVYHQGLTDQDQAFLNRILPCQFTEYKFAVQTDFENINFKHFTHFDIIDNIS